MWAVENSEFLWKSRDDRSRVVQPNKQMLHLGNIAGIRDHGVGLWGGAA